MEALDSAESRFGNRVRFEREQRGWSQSELAQRVSERGVAMHPSTITKIEARDAERPRSIRLDEAYALSQVFGTSLETMLGTERAYDAAAIVAAVHSECHNFGNELTRMMANVSATLLRANSPVPKDPSECSRIEREVLLLQALCAGDLKTKVNWVIETLNLMIETSELSDPYLLERVLNGIDQAIQDGARDSAEA